MGVEIERKFLLKNEAWKKEVIRSQKIAQGYLSNVKEVESTSSTIRVRVSDDKAWITVKSNNKGISRSEYEYEIPVLDGQEMLENLCEQKVEKIRHHVMHDHVHFEIDEFLGENLGLILAEVELPSIDSPHPTPDWLGQEVSDEGRYYNVNLITNPYSKWLKSKPLNFK